MVPVNEFNRLSNYYQGKITESALLNKAGRLAAEQLILDDKSIPDSLAVRMVKPMALEQGRLVKRVRTGTAQPTAYAAVEEPEGMVDTPIHRMQIWRTARSSPGTSRMEARLVRLRCFVLTGKSCFVVDLVFFISLCLRVAVSLNVTRRDTNLLPFTS